MNAIPSSGSHQAGPTRKARKSKLPLVPLLYPSFLSRSVQKIGDDESLPPASLLIHSFKVNPSHSPERWAPCTSQREDRETPPEGLEQPPRSSLLPCAMPDPNLLLQGGQYSNAPGLYSLSKQKSVPGPQFFSGIHAPKETVHHIVLMLPFHTAYSHHGYVHKPLLPLPPCGRTHR